MSGEPTASNALQAMFDLQIVAYPARVLAAAF